MGAAGGAGAAGRAAAGEELAAGDREGIRMRVDDLFKRPEDPPLRPFRIHLSDGKVIPVTEPEMVIVGASTAILPTPFGRSRQGRRYARDRETGVLLSILPPNPAGHRGLPLLAWCSPSALSSPGA